MCPVAQRRAAFCTLCSLVTLEVLAIGAQAGQAYSSMGRVYVLYVLTRVSLCCPQSVPDIAFTSLSVPFALSSVSLVCSEKLSFGSNVRPRIFGFGVVLSLVPSIFRFNW